MWEDDPEMQVLQVLREALRGAAERLGKLGSLRACAADAAATFVLPLSGCADRARSARHLIIHDGTKMDLLVVAENRGRVGGPSSVSLD